ncbi:MAG: DNA/RNA non-specific endonuclease [Bacteroidales bacterium]|nr:DNA/RNA non-specific endonuclease [Bacteroidales bacterium]
MKYLKLFFLYALGCLTVVLATTSCGDDDDGLQFGQSGGGSTAGTPSKEITERMETPQVLTNGSTVLLSHFTQEGGKDVLCYSVEYDKAKLHSRWVAFRFDGNTRARTVSRSDEPFADDPDLPDNLKIGTNGFGYNYNRGHLCASSDRLYSRNANTVTFYMSNMSPQLGSFNQAYWITLENLVQKLGRDNTFADTLYVVKGGTVKDNQIKEWLTRPNGKKVAVPQYYFMALLKVKNGVYSSIAFWMEHKDYGYDFNNQAPLSDIAGDALSVNELEEKTGINFFPNLTKIKQKEESIEAQFTPSNWKM